jgi:hypothetical protein
VRLISSSTCSKLHSSIAGVNQWLESKGAGCFDEGAHQLDPPARATEQDAYLPALGTSSDQPCW